MEWFATWFDSPYYPLLYQHRDENEAKDFVAALVAKGVLQPGLRVLDLGCGDGRHVVALAEAGCQVTGIDLSPASIARAQSRPGASACQWRMLDMRELDYSNAFDIVLNLFTSFGYFDNLADNRKILAAIHKALVPNGLLVLDYLNPTLTKKQLVAAETQKVGDLQFDITRKIEGGFVVKTIEVQKEGKTEKFREKVRLFDREDFQEFFQAEGFRLEAIWGDYHGTPFAPETSPRMLLFARKLAS